MATNGARIEPGNGGAPRPGGWARGVGAARGPRRSADHHHRALPVAGDPDPEPAAATHRFALVVPGHPGQPAVVAAAPDLDRPAGVAAVRVLAAAGADTSLDELLQDGGAT